MEQIQQKGSRDGNAIFAQMPGLERRGRQGDGVSDRSEGTYSPRKDDERAKPARVPLDPRRDFAKECAGAASLEKDPM